MKTVEGVFSGVCAQGSVPGSAHVCVPVLESHVEHMCIHISLHLNIRSSAMIFLACSSDLCKASKVAVVADASEGERNTICKVR